MKKGLIVIHAVIICMMLTVTYAFAAPGKTEKKEVKKEDTTTEKQKETTTAAKPKTENKEPEELNIEESENKTEEESDIEDTEEVSENQEESDDSEEDEIDDEEMDHCDHEWVQTGYAVNPDSSTGHTKERECKKCHLCESEEVSLEEFEEATEDDQGIYDEEDYDAAQQEESEE